MRTVNLNQRHLVDLRFYNLTCDLLDTMSRLDITAVFVLLTYLQCALCDGAEYERKYRETVHRAQCQAHCLTKVGYTLFYFLCFFLEILHITLCILYYYILYIYYVFCVIWLLTMRLLRCLKKITQTTSCILLADLQPCWQFTFKIAA